MNRLLNTNIKLNNVDLPSIQSKLCDLLGYEISISHIRTIINSWAYYQVLTKMSGHTDLKQIKQKIKKFISLRDEILLYLFNHDISIFEQNSGVFSMFGIRDSLVEFAERLNRKRGSPYSENTLKKQCYFELLFIAESLGLVGPEQYYQASDLKSFLEIITEPLLGYQEEKETLWYYCQEYEKAKNNPNVKEKMPSLIEHCAVYRLTLPIWQELLFIYQDQVAPLMIA